MSTESDFVTIAGGERSATDFENRTLTQPKPSLPECAQRVLDGRGAGPEYWSWLIVRFVADEIAAAGGVEFEIAIH